MGLVSSLQPLQQQREGLSHLTEIVRKDLRDLALMQKELAKHSESSDALANTTTPVQRG